jgi:hypothetical protein
MNIIRDISNIKAIAFSLMIGAFSIFWSGSELLAEPCDPVKVMTRNLFVGSDFKDLLAAKSQTEFSEAVTKAYGAILGTRPVDRMTAIAREIAVQNPDLVGLQEAGILRTGTSRPATKIEFDFLQILLAELGKLNENYATVAVVEGLDAEAASTLGFNVRFTIQNAILARLPSDTCKVAWSNPRFGRYLAQNFVVTPIGLITNPSGWASVDVEAANRRLRFVTTHLALSVNKITIVPLFEAVELQWTAARTPLPIVVVGDFNTAANLATDPTNVIYKNFVRAGFVDVWTKANPNDPGLTCCRPADLKDSNGVLTIRNDLIFVRNGIAIVDSQLVGDKQSDRTASALWPSDHAGVVARLAFTGN